MWISTRSEGSKSSRSRPVALARPMSSTMASYASLRRCSRALGVGKVMVRTSAKPESAACIAQAASM
ncbi:hypothetical protein AQJ91_09835 [Streptomyces dysideae]|uniref:Uncharacterized protein n=1 Tax=Streptomyces dysideae TaxID=909626 RepID=A0A101V2G2_9ACTN|nr:hypothetical protein AQJ91_09835 [Streptomyces dysideae]